MRLICQWVEYNAAKFNQLFSMEPSVKTFPVRQQGFTLIEIIVVVVIIGILATFVAPKFMGKTDTARLVKAKSDIQALESALDLYKLDNFTYPTTDQGLDALINQPAEDSTGRETNRCNILVLMFPNVYYKY